MKNLLQCVVLISAFVLAQCTWHRSVPKAPTKAYPSSPFTLEIRVSSNTVAVGQHLVLEYKLTNVSDQTIDACLDNRGDYIIWGGPSRSKGHLSSPLDGPGRNSVFQLPPQTSLVWQTEIVMPELSPGPATLRGHVTSSCERWAGTVTSQPVWIMIGPSVPPAHGH